MALTFMGQIWYTDMMRPSPFALLTLKYATYTLLAVLVIALLVTVFRAAPNSTKGLLMDVTPQTKEPTNRFGTDRILQGVSLPADAHVLFTVPAGYTISRVTFFGGPDFDQKPYWGYCFSGDELRQQQKGLSNQQVYHPEGFFYSAGELMRQANETASASDPVSVARQVRQGTPAQKVSQHEVMRGGETCYLMSSVVLPAGIDEDGDGLNNMREKLTGTDPLSPDTDQDGISDAQEVFVTHTNPLTYDSDSDGLSDSCEDKNRNGIVDAGETDPNNADTDRDGLCDGNGNATGCPERKLENVSKLDSCPANVPYSECVSMALIRGEDMNQSCTFDQGETDPTKAETYQGVTDWQWKYEQSGLKPGDSHRTP